MKTIFAILFFLSMESFAAPKTPRFVGRVSNFSTVKTSALLVRGVGTTWYESLLGGVQSCKVVESTSKVKENGEFNAKPVQLKGCYRTVGYTNGLHVIAPFGGEWGDRIEIVLPQTDSFENEVKRVEFSTLESQASSFTLSTKSGESVEDWAKKTRRLILESMWFTRIHKLQSLCGLWETIRYLRKYESKGTFGLSTRLSTPPQFLRLFSEFKAGTPNLAPDLQSMNKKPRRRRLHSMRT